MDYTLRVIYHGSIFIALTSVGVHCLKTCQREKLKKIKKERTEWNQAEFVSPKGEGRVRFNVNSSICRTATEKVGNSHLLQADETKEKR